MGNTYNEEYNRVVHEVLSQSKEVGARHTRSREMLFQTMHFDLNDNPYLVQRKPSLLYTIAEMIWYWAGANDTKWISTFSSFWAGLTDDGETANSAYGHVLMNKYGFNQIDKVIKQLQMDKDSRRATIKINAPRSIVYGDIKDSINTKDEWCTMYLQFFVRDGKLHMSSNMRSNDLFFGTPYDLVYFNSIARYIARALNIGLGEHVHFVGSIHIYDKDYNKFDRPENELPKREFVDILDLVDNAPRYYSDIQYLIYSQEDVAGAKEYVKDLREKYVKTIAE